MPLACLPRASGSSQQKIRHVAAAPAGLVEKTSRRGAGLGRRHHFQQDRVHRQQRVLQAVFRDVTVAVTDIEPHDRGNIRDHRLQMRRHQADLPQPEIFCHLTALGHFQ
jgi:hypothetical protein